MPDVIKIKDRLVGVGHPVYIIAEISANHNQSYDSAVKHIHAAKEAGADAVKVQTYTPDTITIASDKPDFQIKSGTLWDGKTLYDLYQEAHMPWEWQPKLKTVADQLGIDFFSSAFDNTAVDFLEKLNVPAHKLASFELVDIPLIEKMASTGKPIIMSTGMASQADIDEAVEAAKNAGCHDLAILKCTSAYPAPPESMQLKKIADYRDRYQVPVGLSDHTLGITVPIAAVALGACIVEKHFTLSRSEKTADSEFSLEPDELTEMVDQIRDTEKALGHGLPDELTEDEEKCRQFRRSLFVVKDIKAGEALTESNIRSIRPGSGLAPKHQKEILGKKATCDLEKGTPLSWKHISQ